MEEVNHDRIQVASPFFNSLLVAPFEFESGPFAKCGERTSYGTRCCS